jgi:hypothetical protein
MLMLDTFSFKALLFTILNIQGPWETRVSALVPKATMLEWHYESQPFSSSRFFFWQ